MTYYKVDEQIPDFNMYASNIGSNSYTLHINNVSKTNGIAEDYVLYVSCGGELVYEENLWNELQVYSYSVEITTDYTGSMCYSYLDVYGSVNGLPSRVISTEQEITQLITPFFYTPAGQATMGGIIGLSVLNIGLIVYIIFKKKIDKWFIEWRNNRKGKRVKRARRRKELEASKESKL